jgi:hypothetical protein
MPVRQLYRHICKGSLLTSFNPPVQNSNLPTSCICLEIVLGIITKHCVCIAVLVSKTKITDRLHEDLYTSLVQMLTTVLLLLLVH